MGGPSAKVYLSAKFCPLVVKAYMLLFQGGPSAKVYLSAEFYLLVVKARHIAPVPGGSICQSIIVSQVLSTGSQGTYTL